MEHSASLRAFPNYQTYPDLMNIKLILAFVIAVLFSSCTSTVYVVEDSGPMVMPRRPAPVVIGATAPGLHISLSGHDHGARPIATRPQIVRIVHQCAEFRVVLLSDGRQVRQNNPNYRGGGGYSGGNYYGGAGGYPGYQQGGRYNSTTNLPPVHPNVYGRRNSTAVTDPRNGSLNGFRSNPANAYLFR